jgi:O-antigen/teichoic acid export membrane protein
MDGTPEQVPELAAGRVLVGRVSASVLDQGLSTATNLLITLVAAGVLGVRGFGTFGVAYLVAVAVVGSVRAAIGSPALVLQDAAARDHASAPFGAALTTGLITGGLVALAALGSGPGLRGPLLALAVVLPGILIQDTGRLVEFAALRPGRALVLDVIWAVALVLGLVVVGTQTRFTATSLLLIWGGSGSLSALWTLWKHGRRLPRPSIHWLHECWEYAWRYLVVFASTLGVFQVTTLILGGISGVAAVGAVRASQVLFGPIQNLATGLMVALVPETSMDTPLRAQRNRLFVVSTMLTFVALAITGVGLLLPDSLGEAILGKSWGSARDLLVPAGLGAAMFGVASGPVIGLRAARAVHESLVVGLQISAFQFVVPVAGAVLADESGYMWALVITWILGTALWWRCYFAIERDWPVATAA